MCTDKNLNKFSFKKMSNISIKEIGILSEVLFGLDDGDLPEDFDVR